MELSYLIFKEKRGQYKIGYHCFYQNYVNRNLSLQPFPVLRTEL